MYLAASVCKQLVTTGSRQNTDCGYAVPSCGSTSCCRRLHRQEPQTRPFVPRPAACLPAAKLLHAASSNAATDEMCIVLLLQAHMC